MSDIVSKVLETVRKADTRFKGVDLTTGSKQQIEEWLKCKNDFFYFLYNYVKLKVPGSDQRFKWHEGQEVLVRSFLVYHYITVLKSRQIGITTIARALVAWLTCFFSNVGVGVISKKGPDATAFVRGSIGILQELPEFICPTFEKKTEQQYHLSNGSYAIAEAVSKADPDNTLRSNPITVLIIDEAAFISKLEEALSGLMPTVITAHTYARQNNVPFGVIVMSTPNKTTGKGSWFFEQYTQSVRNTAICDENDDTMYRALKLHWSYIPLYREHTQWYESQKKILNYKKNLIAQELDCVFLPADKDSIISSEVAVDLGKNQKDPIKTKKLPGGELWQWKEIDKNRKYIVGVDTATGAGNDAFSCVEVFDFETNEQVMEYMGKLPTTEYSNVIKTILKMLHPSYFAIVENNTIGEAVVVDLVKSPSIRMRMFKTVKIHPKTQMVMGKVFGLETTPRTKPLIVEALTDFIENNPTKIYSERLILQIFSARFVEGRLKGKPTDLLMALGFICYCKNYGKAKFIRPQDSTTQNEQINGIDLTQNELLDYLYSGHLPVDKQLKHDMAKNKIKKKHILDILYDI